MADTWASFAPQDFQVAFYPTEIHSPGGHPWRYPNAKEAAPAGWVPLERCMNINPLRKNRPDGSFAYYNT